MAANSILIVYYIYHTDSVGNQSYTAGHVKLAYVVSITRCIYTCPVLSGMWSRPPPEVV